MAIAAVNKKEMISIFELDGCSWFFAALTVSLEKYAKTFLPELELVISAF